MICWWKKNTHSNSIVKLFSKTCRRTIIFRFFILPKKKNLSSYRGRVWKTGGKFEHFRNILAGKCSLLFGNLSHCQYSQFSRCTSIHRADSKIARKFNGNASKSFFSLSPHKTLKINLYGLWTLRELMWFSFPWEKLLLARAAPLPRMWWIRKAHKNVNNNCGHYYPLKFYLERFLFLSGRYWRNSGPFLLYSL